MKKFNLHYLVLLGILVTSITSCEKSEIAEEFDATAKKSLSVLEECSSVVDLVAGRDMVVVGTVSVDVTYDDVLSEKDIIKVTYLTNDDWVISETHLQLFSDYMDFEDVPLTKKGSPKIGNFDYKLNVDNKNEVTFEIDDYEISGDLFVAAHAVVSKGSGAFNFESNLPAQVEFTATPDATGMPSYMDVTITGGTSLDGTYDGFCIDHDVDIYPNTIFVSNVISSLDYSEHMDLVNWIINQDYLNQSPSCLERMFTYGDIQVAIWMLLNDVDVNNMNTNGLGTFSECAADEIVAEALANGQDYVPGCGEKITIVLQPQDIIQPVIIWKEISCGSGSEETAWAKGAEFPGRDWSMFFRACLDE